MKSEIAYSHLVKMKARTTEKDSDPCRIDMGLVFDLEGLMLSYLQKESQNTAFETSRYLKSMISAEIISCFSAVLC